MKKLFGCVRCFLSSEEGPTAVEYGVMLALIVAVSASVITSIGRNVSKTFSSVSSSMGS